MMLLENQTARLGLEGFESPGVEPVFSAKAIAVLQSFTVSQPLP
jgi:hypothetical protein